MSISASFTTENIESFCFTRLERETNDERGSTRPNIIQSIENDEIRVLSLIGSSIRGPSCLIIYFNVAEKENEKLCIFNGLSTET